MPRNMSGGGVSRTLIREALSKLLADQTEPASSQDLATAVYHYLNNDRVSSTAVRLELSRMGVDGVARKTDAGLWVAS